MRKKSNRPTSRNNRFQTLDALRARLTALRVGGSTWVEIAALEEFGGTSAGLLSSILKGYEPKTNLTRAKLNLAPMTAEAPYCSVHNTVHCFDCQTQQVTPITPPAPTRQKTERRPARPYLKAYATPAIKEQVVAAARAAGMTVSDYIIEKLLD